jgi:hypothetical protein
MNDAITLVFPDEPGAPSLQSLQADLLELEEVVNADRETTRSIGVAELALWVGFAADALAVAPVAVGVIRKVIERVRGRGIRNAVVELPNGVKISIDSATPEEIAALVSAWKQEQVVSSRRRNQPG